MSDYTLLVVDDSEDNRYTLTRRLAREGYTRVVTASDGRQALALLRAQPGLPELRSEKTLPFRQAAEMMCGDPPRRELLS